MDRNEIGNGETNTVSGVATREGGVDRNLRNPMPTPCSSWSPPARVAWIETW